MLRELKPFHQYDGPGDGKVVQQLVIPECKKTEVLMDMHEGILGGHWGEENHKVLSERDSTGPANTMMYVTGAKHALNVQPRKLLLLKEDHSARNSHIF